MSELTNKDLSKDKCPRCGGQGYIPTFDFGKKGSTVGCDRCNGTGKITTIKERL